jgi:hypothetical protein
VRISIVEFLQEIEYSAEGAHQRHALGQARLQHIAAHSNTAQCSHAYVPREDKYMLSVMGSGAVQRPLIGAHARQQQDRSTMAASACEVPGCLGGGDLGR